MPAAATSESSTGRGLATGWATAARTGDGDGVVAVAAAVGFTWASSAIFAASDWAGVGRRTAGA